jgi:polyisoprenyl-phosphate glycosyltransferase
MPAASPVELSLVVPLYNEEENLPELRTRLGSLLDDYPGEAVLVNDGSRDRTPEMLDELTADDPRFRAVHLSRNFGHQAAVAAGLRYSRGRAVVVMDADLQDPPELVPQLIARWSEGYEVVYAKRAGREREGVAKRLLAWGYYRILRRLVGLDLPADTGDFCLMDRKVVDLLNAMPERNRYIRGLRAWVGFRQTAVEFVRPPRHAGEVKYTFRRSLGLALNGIISLSKAPLRLATYFGFVVSLASFGLALVYFIQRLQGREAFVKGWASTVIIMLFLGGVQLLTIGIIGEYLSRIYDEVKQRPLYVVRGVTSGGELRDDL